MNWDSLIDSLLRQRKSLLNCKEKLEKMEDGKSPPELDSLIIEVNSIILSADSLRRQSAQIERAKKLLAMADERMDRAEIIQTCQDELAKVGSR